ncbi:MAG: M16 family metallopeptidase [Rhodospirillales bacterium]|tara:strand:+ start:1429 stop:2685 length:1257 start_codon:yes stop_codon:yes gene_type:complete
MTIEMTQLDNGIRIISNSMQNLETVSVGAWVSAGTRHENANENGISHLLEHMAFKGTERRSALQIAEEIEAVGGSINAYTSRENTAYYAKVLKEDIGLAVDIISDILQFSTMETDEVEREREVVIQEINQTKDTPDDIIFDHLQETAFPNQSIGRPILGVEDIVSKLSGKTILNYMKSQYSYSKIIIAAAGNLDHMTLVRQVEELFYNLPSTHIQTTEPTNYIGGNYLEHRDLEQVHVLIGFNGVSYNDPDYYALSVLSMLLGGSMSSRLFQEVREKRGLAYSIYSFASNFDDGGIFGIYAGTGENKVNELIPVVCNELNQLTQNIQNQELSRAQAQLKSSILMNLESSSYQTEQIARQLQIYGRTIKTEEMINNINNVSVKDIIKIATRLLSDKPTLIGIGPINKIESLDSLSSRIN